MGKANRLRPLLMLWAVLCGGIASCSSEQSPDDRNPLATVDQRELDELAMRIWSNDGLPAEKALARAAYRTGHGVGLSDQARARLDGAIDELAFGAIRQAVNNDPFRPRVYWIAAAPARMFGADVPGSRYAFDNPDNVYRTVPIDPDSRYVIHGRRRGDGPADMSFSLIDSLNTQGTVGYLDGRNLKVDNDGSYRITVDSDPADGRPNHLQSPPEAIQLFIRSNLGDWSTEAHDALRVERIDDGRALPPPRSEAAIAREAAQLLRQTGPTYGLALLGLKTMASPVNRLPQPSTTSTPGALVTQANSFGHYRLADDEALVITVTLGGADYFVLPVTDPWMVTVDPGRRLNSMNNRQAIADADGRYRFVVSATDPGVHNWIDTAGQREGTFMVRWQRLTTSGSERPAIETRLVKRSDLPAALPQSTPRVTAAERRLQLDARLKSYSRRFETR